VYIYNPKNIKRKHSGIVVSVPENKDNKVCLKSAGLWTTLTPFNMDISNLFNYLFISNYLFIYK